METNVCVERYHESIQIHLKGVFLLEKPAISLGIDYFFVLQDVSSRVRTCSDCFIEKCVFVLSFGGKLATSNRQKYWITTGVS